jgi:hypothetical protein
VHETIDIGKVKSVGACQQVGLTHHALSQVALPPATPTRPCSGSADVYSGHCTPCFCLNSSTAALQPVNEP